jgi:hypothetical protein
VELHVMRHAHVVQGANIRVVTDRLSSREELARCRAIAYQRLQI